MSGTAPRRAGRGVARPAGRSPSFRSDGIRMAGHCTGPGERRARPADMPPGPSPAPGACGRKTAYRGSATPPMRRQGP
ncbi:hypothetical protein RSSE_c2946 [Ralstonia solanacearum]|nr:hypothetical protein RSSE_c2946 [Ralstonia solanacearum]